MIRALSTSNICRFVNTKAYGLATVFCLTVVLSSCTSNNFDDGLRSSSDSEIISSQPTSSPQLNENSNIASSNISSLLANDHNSSPKVKFLRVVGIPQVSLRSVTNAIRSSAPINAISISRYDNSDALYQIKSYYTAVDEGSGTLLIAIWDILLNSDKTVHRITSEVRTGARGTDPWHVITAGMINAVVGHSMKNLSQWIKSRPLMVERKLVE